MRQTTVQKCFWFIVIIVALIVFSCSFVDSLDVEDGLRAVSNALNAATIYDADLHELSNDDRSIVCKLGDTHTYTFVNFYEKYTGYFLTGELYKSGYGQLTGEVQLLLTEGAPGYQSTEFSITFNNVSLDSGGNITAGGSQYDYHDYGGMDTQFVTSYDTPANISLPTRGVIVPPSWTSYATFITGLFATNDGFYISTSSASTEIIAKYSSTSGEWTEKTITDGLEKFLPRAPNNDRGKFAYFYINGDDRDAEIKADGYGDYLPLTYNSLPEEFSPYNTNEIRLVASGGLTPLHWIVANELAYSDEVGNVYVDVSSHLVDPWEKFTTVTNGARITTAVGKSDDTVIYLGTAGGIYRLGATGTTSFHDLSSFNTSGGSVERILEDGAAMYVGHLWVGYDNKVLHYNGSTWELFTDRDGKFALGRSYIYFDDGVRMHKIDGEETVFMSNISVDESTHMGGGMSMQWEQDDYIYFTNYIRGVLVVKIN